MLTGVLVFDSRTAQFLVLLKQNNWLRMAKCRQRLILQLGFDSQQLCVTPVVV